MTRGYQVLTTTKAIQITGLSQEKGICSICSQTVIQDQCISRVKFRSVQVELGKCHEIHN